MDTLFGNIPAWFRGNDNSVSLYSSVRISRNYKGMNFPSAPGYNGHKESDMRTSGILSEHIKSGNVSSYPVSMMTQEDIIRLKKIRVLPEKRNEALVRMTLHRNNGTGALLLTNHTDHLTFFCHESGTSVEKAYRKCKDFEALFGNDLFATDPNGNFLTSGLDHFGSGMKCFSVITLPAVSLFGDAGELRALLGMNGAEVMSFTGNNDGLPFIIASKDSFQNEKAVLGHFRELLTELKTLSVRLCDESSSKAGRIREDLKKIISSENLTFKDFIKIYYILSFLVRIMNTGTLIREMNGSLALLIQGSYGAVSGGPVRKSLTDDLLKKAEKTLKRSIQ